MSRLEENERRKAQNGQKGKRMTHKEAVECAEKLKEFCEKRECLRCPFSVKVNEYDDACIINTPASWEKERAIRLVEEENARRDEALYKAGY